ncbi:glycoside hydrolase family 16 protein [Mycena metata]|uniref:Glycoside hydrolase family 16 protein n=1 Tax=Mycena metata TaxID=1033252 RepID=A0AAD7NQ63_9AGAR|nr:glycoside hydrolase family 16 protein [Mycena metata]
MSRRTFQREASPNPISRSPDPALWETNTSPHYAEPDDALHDPSPSKTPKAIAISRRGLINIGCLILLCLILLVLFLGYPVGSFIRRTSSKSSTNAVNATGQVAAIGNFGLIDLDTPADAYNIKSMYSGKDMKLVFSDEFNMDGRSFYPGDDPYWEAVDLHYWATNNSEWYDPAAVTTGNGSLKITLSKMETHNLSYQGGLVTTWYRFLESFLFTGGLLVTAASLPGTNNIHGLWPAFWTMGNLGRAGYGASLDGMWPYTYDACDVGTVPNQTLNNLPEIAMTSGSKDAPYHGELSYLPGQRLSRCTCPGESHPGPAHSDGTYVGRSAPEIDVFEAQVRKLIHPGWFPNLVAQIQDGAGTVSQSAQWAPFNAGYIWLNTSDNFAVADPDISALNIYVGGVTQQASSVVTQTNQKCYELLDNCYSVYGIEARFNDAYIQWISDNKPSWTIHAAGLGADPQTKISARPVPQEPMYIIANLGISTNFGPVDWDHLTFPTTMSLDYVRVYQYEDAINIGCDPPAFPTQEYINTHPLLTTWVDDYNQSVPKNSWMGKC